MSESTPSPNDGTMRALPGETSVSAQEGPTLRGYLSAVRRHLWLVVLLALIGLGLSAYAVQRNDPVFSSRTVIQLPEDRAGPSGGLAGLAASITGSGGSITSQAQVLHSRLLVGQVVDTLGLRITREIRALPRDKYRPVGWVDQASVADAFPGGEIAMTFDASGVRAEMDGETIEAAYGERIDFGPVSFVVPQPPPVEEVELAVIPRESAIDAVIEEMRIFVREGTNLIDVTTTGYDPYITQRIADTAADRYRQFTSGRTREQAERRRAFAMEQLRTTEELLLQTQDELTRFRQREGLYSSRAQAVMDQTGRAELEIMEAELVAEREVYESLLDRIAASNGAVTTEVLRAIISSPSTLANPAIMTRYENLMEYEVSRDSMVTGRFAASPNNPDVARLDSIIAFTQRDLLALTRGHIDALDARLSAVRMVRERVDDTFQHLAETEPEEIRLMMQIEAIGEAATELRQQFYTAGMAEAGLVDQVTILDHALPGRPAGSGPYRTVLLGLIFGLMIGAAGAIAIDSANSSIRRREEVERVLRVPELGVIPRIGPDAGRQRLRLPARIWPANGNGTAVVGTSGPAGDLVASTDVHSAAAEAYRTLRTNLVGSTTLEGSRSLMVTSPSSAEGKTTTAANLAVTFAHQGRRVLLLDCDLRRPRLHQILGVPREPGVADVVTGSVDVASAIQPTSVDRLWILPAGSAPPLSAADLLADGVVRQLLDRVSGDFDLVVVDSPPVLMTADAPILASQVDGVLLVLKAGQTERETAQYAVHQLSAVGARVVGAVLNDVDGSMEGQPGTYAAAGYAGTR